jgi:hypothetical protein
MRIKLALLAMTMVGPGMLLATCGMTDVRQNVVAGTLSGVQSVTASWIASLLPPPPAVWPG